ncbi:MAG: hypothetical protein ABGX25_03845 [Nautiliaceae bacterium]
MKKIIIAFFILVIFAEVIFQIFLQKENNNLKIIYKDKSFLKVTKTRGEKKVDIKNFFINEKWIINKLEKCININKIEQKSLKEGGLLYEKGIFTVEINASYKDFMKCIYLLENSSKILSVDEFTLSKNGAVFVIKYFGVSF